MDVADVPSLPPVPSVRERDIDLLLAELFVTRPTLVEWLVERACCAGYDVPLGPLSSVHAVVNYSRPEAAGDAAGETDVLVEANFADGTLILSIEDKAWAAPQDRQGQRHVRFSRRAARPWGRAVIVAPQTWLSGHETEADVYDLSVSLEDLADWCRSQDDGLEFKAQVFDQACVPPGPGEWAEVLQQWNAYVDGILAEHHGLRLAPTRHIRTTKKGLAKPGRYISCAADTLPVVDGVGRPTLRLKTASANFGARADIEIANATEALEEFVRPLADEAGYETRRTRRGTLIVSNIVTAASGWAPGPPAHQEQRTRAIAQGAEDLRDWWLDAVSRFVDDTS